MSTTMLRLGDRREDLAPPARADPARASSVIFASLQIVGHSRHQDVFHARVLLRPPRCPRLVREARAHVHRHVVALGELDGADLQHLGAEAGQLQHLVERDALELARVRARCADRSCRRRRRRCRSRTRRPSTAAAIATALVSLPPRPSVVMLPSSSTPWKPATTATPPSPTTLEHVRARRCCGCGRGRSTPVGRRCGSDGRAASAPARRL